MRGATRGGGGKDGLAPVAAAKRCRSSGLEAGIGRGREAITRCAIRQLPLGLRPCTPSTWGTTAPSTLKLELSSLSLLVLSEPSKSSGDA